MTALRWRDPASLLEHGVTKVRHYHQIYFAFTKECKVYTNILQGRGGKGVGRAAMEEARMTIVTVMATQEAFTRFPSVQLLRIANRLGTPSVALRLSPQRTRVERSKTRRLYERINTIGRTREHN